jgi:hypothetical protein
MRISNLSANTGAHRKAGHPMTPSLVPSLLEVPRPRAHDARTSERGLGLPKGGLGPPPAAQGCGSARLSVRRRFDPATEDGTGGSGPTSPYRRDVAPHCGPPGMEAPRKPGVRFGRGVTPRSRWARADITDRLTFATSGRDPPGRAARRFRGNGARWHTRRVPSTIRTTCVACGTVELPVTDGRLVLSLHRDDARNIVEFTCPRCGLAGSQRVDERGTRLLAAAGIEVVAPSPATAPVTDAGSDEVDAIGG